MNDARGDESSISNGVCPCAERHPLRRVVLTGGPGAGKTAVLELLTHLVCRHVVVTREAANILFSGGFPRSADIPARRAAQRAIYHVQIELEALASQGNPALVICDRGVVDGWAYWPGPESFWDAIGMSRAAALERYDTVIHLRTPDGANGYGHQNPMRTETPAEARAIDERIAEAWNGHPRRFVVDPAADFVTKAARAIALVLAEIPACCRAASGSAAASELANQPAALAPTTSTGQRAP